MRTLSECGERICAMFDAYCKTVIRNACRSLRKAMMGRANQRCSFISLDQAEGMLRREDIYPCEQLMLCIGTISGQMDCEDLYKKLRRLPASQQQVLLLQYWYDWTRKAIAEYMEVTTRTVYNLWRRAIDTIRTYYERNGENDSGL